MNTIALLFALVAAASAMPTDLKEVPILKDERIYPEASGYSTDVETGNGIQVVESGAPGVEGQINVQGVFKYPLDDGTIAEVKFVADEFGFKPESSLLPVAPVFPHPIPQHSLDQIAFAEEQRRLEAQRSK